MQILFHPDAWIDHSKTKKGYEIPFNRHCSVFTPPRPMEEIDAELKQVTEQIPEMIGWLSAGENPARQTPRLFALPRKPVSWFTRLKRHENHA